MQKFALGVTVVLHIFTKIGLFINVNNSFHYQVIKICLVANTLSQLGSHTRAYMVMLKSAFLQLSAVSLP